VAPAAPHALAGVDEKETAAAADARHENLPGRGLGALKGPASSRLITDPTRTCARSLGSFLCAYVFECVETES